MNRKKLKRALMKHEGVVLVPYEDTKGKTTIGIGRNLSDRGITVEEAEYLCDNDINLVERRLDAAAPWWRSLPESTQNGLAEMLFNLGWPKLSGFKRMFKALMEGDLEEAKKEALDSKWAREDVSKERSSFIAREIGGEDLDP